jgi:hypothetical protein
MKLITLLLVCIAAMIAQSVVYHFTQRIFR